MSQKKLYIISGCNGAGKTTASFNILPELAKDRVIKRVSEGGHGIAPMVIERRFKAGIKNLLNLYCDKVDSLLIYDNSAIDSELIAEKEVNENSFNVCDDEKFSKLNSITNE